MYQLREQQITPINNDSAQECNFNRPFAWTQASNPIATFRIDDNPSMAACITK